MSDSTENVGTIHTITKVVSFDTQKPTEIALVENNKTTKTTPQHFFVANGFKFNFFTPLIKFISFMRNKDFQRELQHFRHKFNQQIMLGQHETIPCLSKTYLARRRDGIPFSILQAPLLTIADFFHGILTLPGNSFTFLQTDNDQMYSATFDKLITKLDPFFALNFGIAEKAWAEHTPVHRDKIAAVTQFEERCQTLPPSEITLPSFTSPRSQDWKIFGDVLRRHWRNSYLMNFDQVEAKQYLQRWELLSTEVRADFQAPHIWGDREPTQKWCRPPGVNKILLNALVHQFYEFHDGNDIFDISFPEKGTDFFKRKHIKDGAMLNPPYKKTLLTRIIIKLVKFSIQLRRTYAVLVPYYPEKNWFLLCKELEYPILCLSEKLAFQRGPEREWRSTADFHSCWILIGATTPLKEIPVHVDMFGFPLNLDYTQAFNKICFPQNAMSSYPRISPRGLNVRMKIFKALFHVAKTHDSLREAADVTSQFDIKLMTKYNFLLQTVTPSDHNFTETCSDIKLDPYLQQHAIWPSFKRERTVLTYSQLNRFLEYFENNPRPKDKTQHAQCYICKKRGHMPRLCPHRVPELHELGLVDRLDILMYQYLATLDFNIYKNQPRDHFRTPALFERRLSHWLQTEAIFWSKFAKFLAQHGISDISSFSDNEEFSKGRQALGFNYAMGAQRPELILDAFGAVLDLIEPPPPCEYKPSAKEGESFISPQMSAEDLKELKRRTCYRVPRNHIKWILPRFSVCNSDQTTRHINDCRYLGPSTVTNRFRLPSRQELRKFAPGDLVLAIDGKSAYKQRRLAWGDRNKIGFRTRIHNQDCYIVMVTLPFGLHNAGFIYQISLKRKLQRIVGHLFFIEYIDDVTIKFSHRNEDKNKAEWTANALLYLTSKIGEIFNNKIEVFQDCITMLGVNFYPQTDRFTPKISTFHKLGISFFDILNHNKFSIKRLDSVLGLLNWMLPDEYRYLKTPLSGALMKAQKEQELHNKFFPSHKKVRDTTTFWPITSAFADASFELMLTITEQYLYTALPKIDVTGSTIFIVVDSNPLVAGGFVFFQKQTSSFYPMSELKLERIEISQIPEWFIEEHELRDIFNSFRFEAVGLAAFLEKAENHIRQLATKANNVIVLSDNRGLVQKLHKGNANHPLAFLLHQKIFAFLRSLKLPYCFRWLPRDHTYIALADEIGRPSAGSTFALTQLSEKLIKGHLPGPLLTPDCFKAFPNFTYLMPKHLFAVDNRKGLPFLLLPPNIKVKQLRLTLAWLTQLDYSILICFPLLRKNLDTEFLDANSPIGTLDLRPCYFKGIKTVTPRYPKNFPMCFGTIKQMSSHPFLL